ncbi:hypothetical protein H1R20_g11690, partial [Candolleomyces eurysporus]
MTSKINVDGILSFEQPFVRVPFENYRKIFRISQKNIEKELSATQNTLNDLATRSASGEVDAASAMEAIENLIKKVENLKQKLSDLQETAAKPTLDVMRERLHHLGTIVNTDSPNADEFARWADTRLDRWIVDWCLRTGKERTAKQVAKERGIETLVDIELFSDIRRIETALSNHSCTEALAWCSENKSALRKVKSTLEFELRLQEYIELCRARKTVEANAYLKKYLAQWHDNYLSQIQQAANLLIFPPTTTCGPYRRLYDSSRWDHLVRSFRFAIYNLNSIPTEPLLHLALYAGLVALKLPACYDPSTKNVDCPVCDTCSGDSSLGLGKLAEEVPYSHHANSTIVCRLTGKIVNEDNPPMAFPNGRVYSREALEEMAAKSNGMVTCPRTGQMVNYSELRKVFISQISEATHKKSGKVYAIKILNKIHLARKKMINSVMMEKNALVALCSRPELHPGIVRLHYCFHDPINLYFVLDLAPNGDLKALVLKLGSLSLECARFYTAQMIDAILYMHEAGVAHRDIKPENCLLDDSMRILLADFGSAHVSSDLSVHRTSTFVGTAMFISPEVLGRPDIWATGACLYFYLFGTYPFAAATDYLVMERIKKLQFSVPEDCDPDAAELIKKLLVLFYPAERLGIAPHSSPTELRAHPFFADINWESLWTSPVPEITPGAFKKDKTDAKTEEEKEELWAKFGEIAIVDN